MRVLIQLPLHERHRSLARGWALALECAGFPAHCWDPATAAAFDAFDAVRPDLFIASRVGGRDVSECLREYPQCRVARDERPAFDPIVHRPAPPDPALECDVALVAGYREEKRGLLDRYVLPLLREYKVKIFGREPWDVAEYLGVVADATIPRIYASAKVVLDVSEHRPSERAYTAMGLGAACVANTPLGAGPPMLLGDGHTPVKFVDRVGLMIHHYDDDDRAMIGRMGRRLVAEGHTYFHRVAGMLEACGLPREARRVLDAYQAL